MTADLFPANLEPDSFSFGQNKGGGEKVIQVFPVSRQLLDDITLSLNEEEIDLDTGIVVSPETTGDWTINLEGMSFAELDNIVLVVAYKAEFFHDG